MKKALSRPLNVQTLSELFLPAAGTKPMFSSADLVVALDAVPRKEAASGATGKRYTVEGYGLLLCKKRG